MRCFCRGLIAVLVLVAGVAAIPATAGAQQSAAEAEAPEVRIVARRLESGRVEFAMQHLGGGGEWGERTLPSRRFFPTTARVGRWLHSSSLSIDTTPATELRIVARRLQSGGLEFGLERRGADGEWGERQLPRRRFLPSDATVGRWLASSVLTVGGGFSSTEGRRGGRSLAAVSNGRTCVVRPAGDLLCWGRHGRRDNLSASLLDGVAAVALGQQPDVEPHSCALHANGRVSCWGAGYGGLLGQGDDLEHWVPVEVPGLTDVVSISAGIQHTCAVHGDGGVSCWGANGLGQLGDGTVESSSRPQRVPGLRGVAAVASSGHTNCALHDDGSVSCWGWSGMGMTPDGMPGDHLSPRKVTGLPAVDSVAVGYDRACVVDRRGRVHCWSFTHSLHTTPAPRRVAGINDAVAVSAGRGSACVVHRDGEVSCWGEAKSTGQLGDGTTSPRSRPARVRGITDAVAIAVSSVFREGHAHACAVQGDGSVSCWGGNGFGQLGGGAGEASPHPVHIERFDAYAVEQVPTDTTSFLRFWLDSVVADLEADSPWLRAAWDHIRDRSAFEPSEDPSHKVSSVSVECGTPGGDLACRARSMLLGTMTLKTAVHQLAHVYDVTTWLTPDRAWGAVQVYFIARYAHCIEEKGWYDPPSEFLTYGMEVIAIPEYQPRTAGPPVHDPSGCFFGGPEQAGGPESVIASGLAGEVPQWYTEHIKSGADLWAVLRSAPSSPALANLRHEFGGLCPAEWLRRPFDGQSQPPQGANPFRDGGC